MKTATVNLRSISPYSQSRYHDTPKLSKESAEDYERRTWKERLHYDDDGQVFIPQMALKFCLAECAKYLSTQIPGKGKATYTKHFDAGVLVTDPVYLGFHKDEVDGEWFFVNANGTRGSGSRVKRCYPDIKEWEGKAVFHILDDTITKDVFADHLRQAGQFIGIGRFRPRNGGFYGRFEVLGDIQWQEN